MNNESNEKEIRFASLDYNEQHEYLMKGLLLLGWIADVRFTPEDSLGLYETCNEAFSIQKAGNLTPDIIDDLSLRAYNILKYQIVNVQERADCISTWYFNSVNIKPLLPLIDEATMSFYRGYDLASLSIMFIVLERYLRNVIQWTPAQGEIQFWKLRDSVLTLPNTKQANIAYKIITTIYARFDSLSPAQFYFNRHGLLHGLRGSTEYDQMNCARIFLLFDQLCRAENIHRTAYSDCLEMLKHRMTIFSRCNENKQEIDLLSIVY
jgi:hypothetical protein